MPPAAALDNLSMGPYLQISLNISEADPGNDEAYLFTICSSAPPLADQMLDTFCGPQSLAE